METKPARTLWPRATLTTQNTEPKGKLLDGLLTIKELMQELGYDSPVSIYNLCYRGLPYIQLAGRRLYDFRKVRQWIEAQTVDLSPRKPGRPPQAEKEKSPPRRPARC